MIFNVFLGPSGIAWLSCFDTTIVIEFVGIVNPPELWGFLQDEKSYQQGLVTAQKPTEFVISGLL